MDFVLRALVGGLLVAGVPVVASHFGRTAAGLLMLVPVVTLVSLAYVWWDLGPSVAGTVSLAGLLGLPSVAAFLLTVWLLSNRLGSPWLVLSFGLVAWMVVAVSIYGVIEVRPI